MESVEIQKKKSRVRVSVDDQRTFTSVVRDMQETQKQNLMNCVRLDSNPSAINTTLITMTSVGQNAATVMTTSDNNNNLPIVR